jgi:hypothetical protein
MACAAANGVHSLAGTLTHRAGPALPSYLALHHAGFSVPPVSPPERWALTPPFHPCQTSRAFRRRLTGFPVRCHRASLRRRSILCGTFRDAVVAAGLPRRLQLRPLALPGALPCQEFRCPVLGRLSASANGPACLRTVSGLSSRPNVVAAALRRHSTARASDHPARPPYSLY